MGASKSIFSWYLHIDTCRDGLTEKLVFTEKLGVHNILIFLTVIKKRSCIIGSQVFYQNGFWPIRAKHRCLSHMR